MDKIISRIDATCEKEDLNRMRGMVKYYDDKTESHLLLEEDVLKDPVRTFLYKRKFFKFQKKYRIVLKKTQENDVMLNVGDVQDIAYNLGEITLNKFPIGIRYEEKV